MTRSTSRRRPAWAVALIVAAVIAVLGAISALFGGYHLAILSAVILIPTLMVAAVLFFARSSVDRRG